MAEKKNPGDRHKYKPLQLRLHAQLRAQLKVLADRNLRTVTAEATTAILEHLKAAGLWPPPSNGD